jgi:acyl carrier protein
MPLDPRTEADIRELVLGYFAAECGVDRAGLTDETDIIRDLQGDSLMLLTLLERVRRKYSLSIELKTLGRHLMKKPASTIGQVTALTLAIVEYGDDIVNVDL